MTHKSKINTPPVPPAVPSEAFEDPPFDLPEAHPHAPTPASQAPGPSISARAMAGNLPPARQAQNYLDGLNPEQRDAVEHTEGPLLVLAGAGTGKTRVLTTRLAHLLASRKAWPSQILSVTFTNKAAREMIHRTGQLIGGMVEGMPWLGTFHSIGVKILRRHAELVGLKPDFTILDTDDQIRLMKQLIAVENLDEKRWPGRVLAQLIDSWKNRGLTPDQVPAGEGASFGGGKGKKLYTAYQERLKTLNAADFGDLLLECIRLFRTHPEVLRQYQNRFRYILVDEYQDTNVAQYLWLRLLAQSQPHTDATVSAASAAGFPSPQGGEGGEHSEPGEGDQVYRESGPPSPHPSPHRGEGAERSPRHAVASPAPLHQKNICCVGDDDQSIYGWRGAEVDNILRFDHDFPGAKVIRLERNYRSTAHILAAASHLIAHNEGRLGKTLRTEDVPGHKVQVTSCWDSEEEARSIGDEIEQLQRDDGTGRPHDLDEIAILVRASFQMREFEDRFVTLGLPYRVIGGPRFYERQEIKDAIAYLEVTLNPANDLKFERIINVPKRGLGDTAVRRVTELARARGGEPLFYDLLNWQKQSIALDFGAANGIAALRALISRADIVIESARPRALAQLGVLADRCVAAKAGLTWLSITGHGRAAPQEEWIGFGDDCAVAAGLSWRMRQAHGAPMFCGDAIADPLTGLHAALAAWASWREGGGEIVALSLAGVTAHALTSDPVPAIAVRTQAWAALAADDQHHPYPARRAPRPAPSLGADTARTLEELLC